MLSVKVCKWCFDRHAADQWKGLSDSAWARFKFVICPLEISEMAIVDPVRLDGDPPGWCPYVVEHTVSDGLPASGSTVGRKPTFVDWSCSVCGKTEKRKKSKAVLKKCDDCKKKMRARHRGATEHDEIVCRDCETEFTTSYRGQARCPACLEKWRQARGRKPKQAKK